MAGKQVNFEVNVDSSDGVRGLKDFSKAAQKAGKDAAKGLEDTATAGDKARTAIKTMAEAFDTELRDAAKAADALKTALGETADKFDADQIVVDLNRMGVSFDEIRGDADKFATTLKQVDGIKLQQVNDGLTNLDGKMRQVHSSSDQSRSVLANLAGNAAQDLGELGGVVGSLGVGIGQLAEYAVDGNIALGNLAKVAGPMAGLALALGAVGVVTGENRKKQEQYNSILEAFTQELGDATSATDAINVALSENKDLFDGISKLGFEGALQDAIPLLGRAVDDLTLSTEENIAAMAQAGITVDQWAAALTGTNAERTAFIQTMKDMVDAGLITQEQFQSLSLVFGDHRASLEKATEEQKNWDAVTQQTARTAGEITDAYTEQAVALGAQEVLWGRLTRDLKDGAISTERGADAYNRLRDELGLTTEEMDELVQTKVAEQLEADAEAAEQLQQAMRDAGDAIADIRLDLPDLGAELADSLDVADTAVDFQGVKAGVDDAIEDLQAYIDENGAIDWSALFDTSQLDPGAIDADMVGLVQGVRDSLQEGIVDAFEIGGVPAAQHFLDTFVPQLMEQGGLTEAQVFQLLGIPEDGTIDAVLQPIIDQAAADRAMAILDAIAGTGVEDPRIAAIKIALLGDDIPAEIAEIAALLLAQELGIPVNLGDFAPSDIAAAQDYLDANPVTIPSSLDTDQARRDADDFRGKQEADKVKVVAEVDTQAASDKAKAFISQPRTATITAEAAVAVANIVLALTASKPRKAVITADAHTAQAERDLNQLTRDRYADVFVRTHGSAAVPAATAVPGATATGLAAAPTTTSGGGGGGVAILAAPAPVNHVANVTINAGVVGNHFDVQRAVTRALRQSQRLNGRRN